MVSSKGRRESQLGGNKSGLSRVVVSRREVMRRLGLTDEEVDLTRHAVTVMIDEYVKAVRKYGTAEHSLKVNQETLNAWSHNADVLRKVRTKLV